MPKKKTIEELQAEQEKLEQELQIKAQKLKALKAQTTEQIRKERTHRLCTHGAMLEQYLPPEEYTDEQIDKFLTLSFEDSITDKHGRKAVTAGESKRFGAVINFMKENNILTVEDFQERVAAISNDGFPERDQIKKIRTQISSVEKLLSYGDLRDDLDPLHDEYMQIHWKGKKEKFAKAHHDELEAWKIADKYMRKNLPDQSYKREELVSELNSLHSELNSLRELLKPREEEAKMLKEVGSYISELLPELVTEGESLTPERRQEKIASIRDRLEKARADVEKRAEAYERDRKLTDRDQER